VLGVQRNRNNVQVSVNFFLLICAYTLQHFVVKMQWNSRAVSDLFACCLFCYTTDSAKTTSTFQAQVNFTSAASWSHFYCRLWRSAIAWTITTNPRRDS
jgi:hypothetical protein